MNHFRNERKDREAEEIHLQDQDEISRLARQIEDLENQLENARRKAAEAENLRRSKYEAERVSETIAGD